jgi:hypothetical protein
MPKTSSFLKLRTVASKMSLTSGSWFDAWQNALGRPSACETASTTCLMPSAMAMIEEITPATAINSVPDMARLNIQSFFFFPKSRCHEAESLFFDALVSCKLMGRKPLYISTGRGATNPLTGADFP